MNEKYGDSGPAVEAIQRQLNCAVETRLPRLSTSGTFDEMTVARLMEWQSLNRLTPVDGIAGPAVHALLDSVPLQCANTRGTGRCILVDLFRRQLNAYENGLRVGPPPGLDSAIIGGGTGRRARSSLGVFRVL